MLPQELLEDRDDQGIGLAAAGWCIDQPAFALEVTLPGFFLEREGGPVLGAEPVRSLTDQSCVGGRFGFGLTGHFVGTEGRL